MKRHKSFEAFLASALVETGFIRVARLKKALDKCEAERVQQATAYKNWRKTYPPKRRKKESTR
jgi:hypothetical protein